MQLDAIPGPQHCPPDLAHYSYRDEIASVPSPLVTQVEVVMQTKSGGNWSKVDSETVSHRRVDGTHGPTAAAPAAAVAPEVMALGARHIWHLPDVPRGPADLASSL